jgi:hypothetical protein
MSVVPQHGIGMRPEDGKSNATMAGLNGALFEEGLATVTFKISHGARQTETRRVCQRRMKDVMGLLNFLNIFSRTSRASPASRRLDGRSRALLAASFRPLRDGEEGWITMQEAGKLFSPVEDHDAFGETDRLGNVNLLAFASALGEAQFEFSPAAGRLYFARKANRAALHVSDPRKVLAHIR